MQRTNLIQTAIKPLLLASAWLSLTVIPASAQTPTYHVQVINKNGITSPGDILQLLKDNKGFLWLLSTTKAQRYDGKNFLTFSFDERCLNIQQDGEGNIWLATRQSLYRYKNDYRGFEKLTAWSADSTQYLQMHAGPGKKIYLLTSKKILQWNAVAKKMDTLPVTIQEGRTNFNFLKSSGNYLFYHKSQALLARYNVITKAIDELPVKDANFLFPLNEDSIWVRQDIGGSVLVSFTAKTITPVTGGQFSEKFNDNRYFITGSNRNAEFISVNDKGYFAFNGVAKKFSKLTLLYNGLPLAGSPPINSFYEEENGTIWFANEEGLVHFNPGLSTIGLLRSNAASTEKWNNDVRNITEDEKGNIWFSTANGFCRLNKADRTVKAWMPQFESNTYLNYSSVRSIGYSNGKIIVGQSEKGFWIFNPANNSFKRPVYENDSIQKVFEGSFNSNMIRLRNGNFLILSRRVWLMDKENFKVQQIKLPYVEPVPRSAYEDEQGRIWLLGRNGILAVDKNFGQLYSLPDRERGKWYNAIVQVNETTFWVASKNLFEVKLRPGGKLELSPLFPELKNVHFTHLYKDLLNNIWMFSDNGIYRYLPAQKIVEKFDRSDNAQPYNASVSNSFRSRDGTLYAASANGINYFVPEKIPEQNDSLQVHLMNVTVNEDDSAFLLGSFKNHLNYSQNAFVFDFISPYINNGEKVQYRYKLDGADKEWVNLGNNTSVRFSSLQPGRYSFNVAASLNGKDWFELQQPFLFVITPPFWQTWWFRSIAAILAAGSIFLFVKRREKFIAKQEAQKTAMEKMKAASYQYQLEIEQVTNFFALSIHQHNTIDDTLWDVAKNLIGKLGFEDGMIYLWNKDKTVLLQKAGYGVKGSMQSEIDKDKYNVRKGKGIVGATVENRKAILVNDTSGDARYFSADGQIRLSELCVPIIHHNEVMGAINTEHTEKDFYTDRHLQILTTIASMLADKIDKLEAQQQAREKEIEVLNLNKDLAIAQLNALRAQMNPHFIFNAMNSIQQFTLKNEVDNANLYLSRFSTLLRKVLHSSQQNFITLDEEMNLLNLYLDIEKLRLGNEFTYTIKADEELETDAVKIPGMLVQPFVENALKHGLASKAGTKKLDVCFSLISENTLLVTVTDNGIGFKKAKELKAQHDKFLPHESKGMALVEQRIKLLGTPGKPVEINIAELNGDGSTGGGTKVSLRIPLQANSE